MIGGSVRAAAVDASQSGYGIAAMDHFGDADLLAVCKRWMYLPRTDAWPDLLCDLPADRDAMIVPTGGFDWPKTEHPPGNGIQHGMIAFPSKRQFDDMRNPKVLAELTRESGIGFPITIELSDVASFIHAQYHASLNVDPQNWLIKPYSGTGGLGIRTPINCQASSISEQLKPDEYLQQRIVGRPIGVNFISRFRAGKYQTHMLGIFAGLTHRKNPDHRWLYGGSIGPLTGDHLHSDINPLESSISNLITLGDRIAKRFELVGLFNVDLMLTPERSLVMLEINPRYSASMELLPAAGCLVDCHVAAYEERVGQLDHHQTDQRFSMLDRCADQESYNVACKRIVYAIKPMRFSQSISQLYDFVSDLVQPLSIAVSFHDLPATDDTIPSGYPVLTVIARAPVPQPSSQSPLNTSEFTHDLKTLVRQTHRIAARLRKLLV